MPRNRFLDLIVHPVQTVDGRLRISAELRGHPKWCIRGRNGVLFFEIPEPWSDDCAIRGTSNDVHDALLRGIIFSAMEARRTLRVHGNISPSLIANLQTYQQRIHGLWPQYRPVEVRADGVAVSRRVAGHGKSILGFSGGVDSIYSLWCHNLENASRESQVGACVFVHGFDIPLSRRREFDQAFQRVNRITSDVGTPLIPVRCNLRDKLPWWPHSSAAALSAVLSLFEHRFEHGLIAGGSGYAVEQMRQIGFGSCEGCDPLLSSDSFAVVHDHAAPRVKKCSVLARWMAARSNLRVCWEGSYVGNCGQCEKCVRQMLCMAAAGVDDLSCFDSELTAARIRRPRGLIGGLFFSTTHGEALESCLAYADRAGRGRAAPIVVLREVLAKKAHKARGLDWRRWSSRLLTPIVSRIY